MPLSFIFIPGLIAVMAVLYSPIKPSSFHEPAWLLPVTNIVLVTMVGFTASYIALRNYRAAGRIQILPRGCGLWTFGTGGIVAALVRSLAAHSADIIGRVRPENETPLPKCCSSPSVWTGPEDYWKDGAEK